MLSQGSIIYGIRSKKYGDVRCYGIIITARCDIAQHKVEELYYCIAVEIGDWLCGDYGYNKLFERKIQNKKQSVKEEINKYELNIDVLCGFEKHDREMVVLNRIKDKNKRDSIQSKIEEYINLSKGGVDYRKEFVKNNDHTTSFLRDVSNGREFHYFFLPRSAYNRNGTLNEGLLVDFQDIHRMPLPIMEYISNGMDVQTLYRQLPAYNTTQRKGGNNRQVII